MERTTRKRYTKAEVPQHLQNATAADTLEGPRRRTDGKYEQQFVHGMKGTRFYYVWHAMRMRCSNPTSKSYPIYGGRGITVCNRWLTFKNFFDDMHESYLAHKKLHSTTTLERRDPDKGYEPANCTWVTRKEQSRNKRNTRRLTYQGRTMGLYDWADEVGIRPGTLHARLKAGWTVDDAIGKAVR